MAKKSGFSYADVKLRQGKHTMQKIVNDMKSLDEGNGIVCVGRNCAMLDII